MRKNTFVHGAAILGLTGLLSKLLGAVYRIPLQNIILSEGMAYFQSAYPIYSLLMVVCSAGLPVAVSQMVSVRASQRDFRGAQDIFLYSAGTFAVVGAALSLLLWLFAAPIAAAIGMPEAQSSLQCIAPLIFICLTISAFRGYFQGLHMMMPTGVSQIIEQACKIVLGLILASNFIKDGPAAGASGAVLGVTIGEALALIFMFVMYMTGYDQMHRRPGINTSDKPASPAKMVSKIWSKGLSITLGASLAPLCVMIDALTSVDLLKAAGYTDSMAVSAFGLFSGVVSPLALLPCALLSGIAVSIVPAIAKFRTQKNYKALRTNAKTGIKFSFLAGIPCAVGLYILAQPLLSLLFGGSLTEAEMTMGTSLLKIMSVGTLFLPVSQTCAGVLQGMGRENTAAITTLFALIIKTVLMRILPSQAFIGVNGIAFSTVICFGVVALLNILYVTILSGIHVDWLGWLLKPGLAAAAMGVLIWYVYYSFLTEIQTWGAILAIVLGMLSYGAFCFLLQALTRGEIASIPSITRFADRSESA